MEEDRKAVQPDEGWAGIEAVANTTEGAILAGFLEGHGIPALVVDRSFHQTPTSDEDLTPIEVAVPKSRVEEARAALARRDEAFAKAPDDALMTDDGPVEVDAAAEPGDTPPVD